MPRYKQAGRLDEPQGDIGDQAFLGVNMRLEPHNVPPGYVSEAINARFRNGNAETRKGVVNISWANKLVAGEWQPWGEVHGVTNFQDPVSGVEYLIIAADGAVYYTYENSAPIALTLAAGITVSGTVEFIQAFDVLIMLRGDDEDPIVMASIAAGFTTITETVSSDTGLFPIPRAKRGVTMANRVFLISLTDNTLEDDDGESVNLSASDNVAFSDALDYTHYSINQEFRINQGENDTLNTLQEFGKSTLLCFKKSSVYRVDNVYGNLDAVSLSTVTSRYGCIAAESVIDTGTDVLWLSKEGIASLTLTQFAEIQTGQGAIATKPRMFSEAIQPLIERINWKYAAGSIGMLWDNKAYFAVPLDDAEIAFDNIAPIFLDASGQTIIDVVQGQTYRWAQGTNETSIVNGADTYTSSTDFIALGSQITLNRSVSSAQTSTIKRVVKGVNNAILVYDFFNGAWSGHDEIPQTSILEMFKYDYRGKERLFIINQDGWVQLYEEDYEDQLSVPYSDLEFIADAAADLAWAVNGGTSVLANSISVSNTSTTIGTSGNLASDRDNLWDDNDAGGGYGPNNGVNLWTCPNSDPVQIATGMRFYSTNGIVPTVDVTTDDESVTLMSEYTTQPITLTLKMRSYVTGTGSKANYQWVTLDVQTWSPKYTISLITEGVEEEDTKVTERTKDRTKWDRPFNKADFEVDNDNGDAMDAYRQDYSVNLGARGATDFALHTITDGVRFDLHQEVREFFRLNNEARSAQIKIVNSDGRFRLVAANITANIKNRQAATRSA